MNGYMTPIASLAIIAVFSGSDNEPHMFGPEFDRMVEQARDLRDGSYECFQAMAAAAYANLEVYYSALASSTNGSN